MSNKVFLRSLAVIVIVGLLFTIGHAIYICKAYPNSSIIYFIAQEMWP